MKANSFVTTIQDHRCGDAIAELSEALQQITKAVRDTGKPGTVKLTLKVHPASKGSGRAVILTDDISIKLPEVDKGSSIFFVTNEGTLSRNDPDQRTLDLKVVAPAPADQSEPLKVAANS